MWEQESLWWTLHSHRRVRQADGNILGIAVRGGFRRAGLQYKYRWIGTCEVGVERRLKRGTRAWFTNAYLHWSNGVVIKKQMQEAGAPRVQRGNIVRRKLVMIDQKEEKLGTGENRRISTPLCWKASG